MNIITKPINDLMPAVYNPRKDLQPGDPEFGKIKTSIEQFGYVDPVIINSDNTIIGGHQRWKVLKELGYTEIDCVVVNFSIEKEKALNIALNKIAGEWDMSKLKAVLDELVAAGFDTSWTGFSDQELSDLDQLLVEDREVQDDNFDLDAALEDITEPETKIGDIWQLGQHLLMCGDSTDSGFITSLMSGIKADLIVTDPPYNVDYEGKTEDHLKIINDKMSAGDFNQFLLSAFTCMHEVADDGAGIYVFHADSAGLAFRDTFVKAGFKLAQCCIWVKQSMVMGRQDYQWQHEPVLYGWKPTGPHHWHSDRKQTTVWNFNRPSKSDLHPTMKPIDLIAYPIQNSCQANDVVLDPFGGSGSTLIACEQLSRKCRMMEFDPKYCDVIKTRWETLTGGKAVLIQQ